MFKKKENNMTYFLGGTAIGVAASLLVGKIISNKSTVKAQTSKVKTHEEEKKKYSQDDNLWNSNFHKNHSHVRSKSESRYENEIGEEYQVPAIFLTNSSLKNNINHQVEEKHSTNVQKICYKQLHNTSIEDNTGYNDELSSNYEKKNEYNNFSESKTMRIMISAGNSDLKNTSNSLLIKESSLGSVNSNSENDGEETSSILDSKDEAEDKIAHSIFSENPHGTHAKSSPKQSNLDNQ
ncbi:uncharacterized protein LOC143181549 [Calliopsis andreniformis]|uniref:uncharacterized protein LOC143181549 n=1 Tax=Calliopsis andreniformis TaxID=337506 RepID=UPI003FCC3E63